MALSNDNLQGKTALITGSARRLGKAISLALADCGVDLILHYNRSKDEAEHLADEIRKKGVQAVLVQEDLEILKNGDPLIEKAINHTPTIDFLINNASIFPETTWDSITIDDLNVSAQINAYAPFLISRSFYKIMGKGAIVNMLDTKVVTADDSHFAYFISKKSLYVLTRQMARLFAPNVRVNGIAPGLILPPSGKGQLFLEEESHRNVLHTYGNTNDISESVLFLLKMEFMTGQVLFVDGGEHLKGTHV